MFLCQKRLRLSWAVDECKPLTCGICFCDVAGRDMRQTAPGACKHWFCRDCLGRAVQVDHVKPKLKLPGAKRLKLKCHKPLSNFAFNFNLRHYTWGSRRASMSGRARQGRHTPPLPTSTSAVCVTGTSAVLVQPVSR